MNYLVGVTGIEPATPGPPAQCSADELHPVLALSLQSLAVRPVKTVEGPAGSQAG